MLNESNWSIVNGSSKVKTINEEKNAELKSAPWSTQEGTELTQHPETKCQSLKHTQDALMEGPGDSLYL